MAYCFLFFASDKYKKQADILEASIKRFHPHQDIVRVDLGHDNSVYVPGLAKRRLEKSLELLDSYDGVVLLGADCKLYRHLFLVDFIMNSRTNAIGLSPHITEWLPEDGLNPSNSGVYMTGHCNADFVVFNGCKKILKELIDLPMKQEPHRGLFYEQTWMSALPFLYPEQTVIMNQPEYNLAYFNVMQRDLKWDEKTNVFTVKGGILALVQFSGFLPDRPETMSKYQDRYKAEGDVLKLFTDYAEELKK